MERQLWFNISLILLVSNTLAVVILIETIIFKFPYLTLFIIITAASIYFNLKLFRLRR